MLLHVALGNGEKFKAAMKVCKGSDAKTVGGVELRLEEVTTSVPHISQLQQIGSWQQDLMRDTTMSFRSIHHRKQSLVLSSVSLLKVLITLEYVSVIAHEL